MDGSAILRKLQLAVPSPLCPPHLGGKNKLEASAMRRLLLHFEFRAVGFVSKGA